MIYTQSRGLLVCAGFLLLLVGCGGNTESGSDIPAYIPAAEQRDVGTISVGDSLELFVKEDASFNGVYKVRERGDIIIPVIGRIPVKGLSTSSAEARITHYLEKQQLREATVIVDRVGRQSGGIDVASSNKMLVYLTGAVNRSGQHVLTITEGRPLGVYEALLVTGGLANFADEQKVHVMRMDNNRVRHKIPVNIRLVRQGKIPDPPIGEGDVVVVPNKVFGF